MGRDRGEIDEALEDFIGRQHVFFVATAPLAAEGHVNVSPKGLDTFRVLGPKRVAYLDLVGSGIETVAHVRENGRLTIMFCAFEGRPTILRLAGRARAVEPVDPEWADLAPQFPEYEGKRAVIVLDVERVADSCGFGVPLYAYQSERSQLADWTHQRGPEGLDRYKAKHNRISIDGLSGLRSVEPGPRETPIA